MKTTRSPTKYYILDEENQPLACSDLRMWGRWMEEDNRQIAETTIGQQQRKEI